MNKVMGIGILERLVYAAVMYVAMRAVAKGYIDSDMAEYVAVGAMGLAGSARAWWVNRPQKLLNDAADQLPPNAKLVMTIPAQASRSDRDDVRNLDVATSDKVQARLGA